MMRRVCMYIFSFSSFIFFGTALPSEFGVKRDHSRLSDRGMIRIYDIGYNCRKVFGGISVFTVESGRLNLMLRARLLLPRYTLLSNLSLIFLSGRFEEV